MRGLLAIIFLQNQSALLYFALTTASLLGGATSIYMVMKDESLKDDDKKSKMEAMKKEMYDRFTKAGLTPEQVKKIKEMDERMRDKMKNKNGSK